ncbi:MAG: hydrogenase maturation protease [Candidatus Dormibacteria bacterium]
MSAGDMPASARGMRRRILIAGVGYPFLHDWSIGNRLAAEFRERRWPAGVEIDDWSFGPVDAVFKLQGADPPYDRVVFFGAVERGREPGAVVRRFWDAGELPPDPDVQARVSEAVTGVISLENLVIICARFNALPREVVLIEVEPVSEEWGDGYSPAVQENLPLLISYLESEATGAGLAAAA